MTTLFHQFLVLFLGYLFRKNDKFEESWGIIYFPISLESDLTCSKLISLCNRYPLLPYHREIHSLFTIYFWVKNIPPPPPPQKKKKKQQQKKLQKKTKKTHTH